MMSKPMIFKRYFLHVSAATPILRPLECKKGVQLLVFPRIYQRLEWNIWPESTAGPERRRSDARSEALPKKTNIDSTWE